MKADDRFALRSVIDLHYCRPDHASGLLPALLERSSQRFLDLAYPKGRAWSRLQRSINQPRSWMRRVPIQGNDSKMSWLLGDLDTLRVPGPFNLVMAGVSILLRSGSAVLRANTTCVLEVG